jgi:hypothetical protein
MSVAWDPVTDTDLAGYRLYYGTTAGQYSSNVDVGNVTAYTLSGLNDCTTWYVAVKAYDAVGNLSSSYSNEINGWPRPVVSSANPPAAEQGRRLDVTVSGTNFRTGATVSFGDPNIVVNSVSVSSCSQLVANITVQNSAAAGSKNVEVVNPDSVYGVGTGVFTVQAAVAPTVSSTTPADGAIDVPVSVHPTVTFSEPMDPASITSATVRLLDPLNQAVAQAAGSPSLSADGRTATITPAAVLDSGLAFRIQAVGGTGGVQDLAGHPLATTYTQATGFETVPDVTAPAISAVNEANVGATSAEIRWTTDEPADSQVFYREVGVTAYQQTSIDPQLVTSHAVLLQGLEPSTSYEYHVRSADEAGNASTSSPDGTFTTLPSSFAYLRFEAEAGDLTSPVRTATDAAALQGAFIDTPAGTPTGSATSPSGTATYGFNLPSSGTWYLWFRLYGASASTDSWFESVDGAARQAVFPAQAGSWQWVAGRSYSLGSGLHTLELGGREAQARADRILITNDPGFVPTEQPGADNAAPGPVASFSATPTNQRNDLRWTNPADADFARTVVRYRTDGRYPTSPVDGFAVTDSAGAPGSAGSFAHDNLTNGTTYFYSAFAIDATGNVSPASRSSAAPVDNVLPGTVRNLRRTDTR